MTQQEINALGPAFAAELRRYRDCFRQQRTADHFDTYCRGLLSDLPRKSVEPIALEAGAAVRTLQEFLVTSRWNQDQARNLLQQRLIEALRDQPDDPLGVVGVIDETSCVKKGDQTPGVQRQYLGCVGKVDNGIVTVHVGVAQGHFQALLDADLYLPESWSDDRERCRHAGIPDTLKYRSKWRIALDQLIRLSDNGMSFDWLTFDEGYGSQVPFLWILGRMGQKYVAEVPKNFLVSGRPDGRAMRADECQPGRGTDQWERFHLDRKTQARQTWRAKGVQVWTTGRWCLLVTAVNETTGEVKYFATNSCDSPLSRILQVAFRRATIEHGFRLAKQEAGLMHYEGRNYTGLTRHLILTLIVLGFVSVHTERVRGKKSRGDAGAGVPRVERAVPDAVSSSARCGGTGSGGPSDPVSSAA